MNLWGLTSPSQVRAQAKYDRDNTTRISLKLNLRTDWDIIQWLRAQVSMQVDLIYRFIYHLFLFIMIVCC